MITCKEPGETVIEIFIYFRRAVVRGAKSSKLVPVPVIHLDSPNPSKDMK